MTLLLLFQQQQPLNDIVYTPGLDRYPGISPTQRVSYLSLWHYTSLADPRPGQLEEGTVIPFGPVAFSPQWVRIECGMGNWLGDLALTLHTRNGGGTICPLLCEICFQIYIGLCLRIRAGVLSGAGPPNCPLSGHLCSGVNTLS